MPDVVQRDVLEGCHLMQAAMMTDFCAGLLHELSVLQPPAADDSLRTVLESSSSNVEGMEAVLQRLLGEIFARLDKVDRTCRT